MSEKQQLTGKSNQDIGLNLARHMPPISDFSRLCEVTVRIVFSPADRNPLGQTGL